MIWLTKQPFLILAAFLALASYQPDSRALHAFGPTGPFDHHRILIDALDRFSRKSGWEVNPICTGLLNNFAYTSDGELGHLDFYHCDNSNFYGCSMMLDRLKRNARNATSQVEAMRDLALALHIVQDFYAHSNWVERYRFSMIQAPIEAMKDYPTPPWLQSGIYPDVNAATATGDPLINYYCMLTPEEAWGEAFPDAGHACLNKDGNNLGRGGSTVDGTFITYHELAGEYAIRHSVEVLNTFRDTVPMFQSCLLPKRSTFGCSQFIAKRFTLRRL